MKNSQQNKNMTSDIILNNGIEENRRIEMEIAGDDDDDEDNKSIPLPSSNSIDEQRRTSLNKIETFDDKEFNDLHNDWLEIDAELRLFEPKHTEYVRKLDEVELLKAKYRDQFDKYKKKVDQLQKEVALLRNSYIKKDEKTKENVQNTNLSNFKNAPNNMNLLKNRNSSFASIPSAHGRGLMYNNSSPALDRLVYTLSHVERLNLISDRLNSYSLYLTRISDTVPRKDSYLKVILGGVDVSILNKADKWHYKQEYEKFKFIVTCISLISSLIIWSLTSSYRAFDASFHFLLVWYYCTLTIRESILVVNGSNINPWWRAHHYISTAATAILLTWPDSDSYHQFRTQFFIFSFYLSFVQVLQFYYQRGCLYRLRALGETHDMDITIEGFHRWMFRGLSFLVPFLVAAYLFQLYNAYSLWQLSYAPTTNEWQVSVLSIIFFVLFLGNISTTINVLREKFREKPRPVLLKQKYQSFKTFLSTSYYRSSNSSNLLNKHKK